MTKRFFVALFLVGMGLTACNSEQATDAKTDAAGTTQTAEATPSQVAGSANTNASDLTHNPATAQGPVSEDEAAKFEFKETEYDFGTIKQGEKVDHVFEFKNSGKQPLIISNAQGSCGCTVPEYPKEPIAPGETGKIKVSYNSTGKKGNEVKYVTIQANTMGENRLTIKANVKE